VRSGSQLLFATHELRCHRLPAADEAAAFK
jgi:hypothetical protein